MKINCVFIVLTLMFILFFFPSCQSVSKMSDVEASYDNKALTLSIFNSTKDELRQADQLFESLIKEDNPLASSSFSSFGFDVTKEDALIYAESAALIGDNFNLYKMLDYLGYQIDIDSIEWKKMENYSQARSLILEGSYSEAYQLLAKDKYYTDSKILRDEMVKLKLVDFEIGDIGPAGGYIFYDKGSYSNGWRYLEAAPNDIGRHYWEDNYSNHDTSEKIGTGKANTNKCVKVYEGGAARACVDYVYNGYSDWFLPSIDELNLMYKNLSKKYPELFSREYYWSSSEYSSYYAWVLVGSGDHYSDFQSTLQYSFKGYHDTTMDKIPFSYAVYVRPVRAF